MIKQAEREAEIAVVSVHGSTALPKDTNAGTTFSYQSMAFLRALDKASRISEPGSRPSPAVAAERISPSQSEFIHTCEGRYR